MRNRPQRWFLFAAAFLTGATTMLAEIAAGRLVAPFYGTSTLVWALLIGAVLASLAFGQLLGGKLARYPYCSESTRGLGILLLASAGLFALLPIAARPSMVQTLAWFRAGSLSTMIASFAGITTMLALPIAALGACGPLLLHLSVDDRERAGVVAGRLYSLGTAGSLLGTYVSGLLLVPWLGTRSTLWLGAASLAALGLIGCWQGRQRLLAAAALVLIVGAGVACPKSPTKSDNTLFEAESRYQYVQVTDDGQTRKLYLNDGYAVQSLFAKDGSLPLRGVWGYYALAPSWTEGGKPRRILLAGFGGGTSARTFRKLFPDAQITGIELDPTVIEAGRRWFELPEDIRIIADDARAALSKPPLSEESARYDVILIDAFQFPYVPFHLCTVEYFQQLENLLAPGGCLVMNVGRDDREHDVVEAVANTLAQVFPWVRAVDVPTRPNTMVVGTRHAALQDAGLQALGLQKSLEQQLARLPALQARKTPERTLVLTDDRAPVEGLTDGVILRRVWSVLWGGWSGS